MPVVFPGCSQLVREHHSTSRQRSPGVLSADTVRVTAATDLEEDGYGAQRRTGKAITWGEKGGWAVRY